MKRNPRRSYDEQGRELAPPSIGECRAQGETTARVWCHDCGHEAIIDIARFPADMPFPDIAPRLRCSACQGRRIGVMKDMEAHYAQLGAQTGWKVEVKRWPKMGPGT